MTFIFSLLMSGIIVVGIFRLFTRPAARRKFAEEMHDDPLKALFVSVWVACWMAFFWGVFVPAFGRREFFDTGLEVWQVGGIGSLIGFVLSMSVKRLGY